MGGTSWAFLLVGSFAAVGAALAFGTLAALVRYHRTGALPGGEPGETSAERLSPGRYATLWVRVAIGLVLAGAGIAVLRGSGLI